MEIKASVIGASGYTGIELIRLLNNHPKVEIKQLLSSTYQGQKISQVFPHLAKIVHGRFTNSQISEVAQESDIVFLALPHTKSIEICEELIEHGCKVIDLSADFRINDSEVYTKWYLHPAPKKSLLETAIYGLPEIGLREKISKANLVANPGCYPTATILGLAPLLASQYIDIQNSFLIVDAKSGISGAGRSLKLDSHFCEVSNNFSAYQAGGIHRHIPEIEQELSKLANTPINISFTPHLIPIPRGMLATIYCKLAFKVAEVNELIQLYEDYYKDHFFVRIMSYESKPGVKAVIGSNFCNISLFLDVRNNQLTIISTLDNLLKGASGQAVQNMNLMFKLAEWTGLQAAGIYP